MIGLKAIARTPVKTALFFMLIAVVTVFLTLGVGMLHSANRMLDEADSAFLTAGEFVFMGGRYPDAVAFDGELKKAASAFDFESIAESPAVLSAERGTLQRAYLDGYVPARNDMPYEKYAVITITVKNADTITGSHISRVTDARYAAEDMPNKSIYVYSHDGMETPLQVGRTYIVFGGFLTVPGQTFRGFQILPFDTIDSLANMPLPPLIDVTDTRDIGAVWQSEAGAAFIRAAEFIRVANNSVTLEASQNVAAMSGFHRGEYTVIEGRMPEAADYKMGGVCLLPKRIASQMNISVGDTVTLRIHPPSKGVGLYESYLPETGFAATADLTVIGIYQAAASDIPIVIPHAGQTWLSPSENNYTLARVVLNNRSAKDFILNVTGLIPAGVQFNVFDDGYQEAVRPIMGMRETAVMITALCAVACLTILFFFGFFFVFRNKETARILCNLGTAPLGVYRYFLVGSGAIALAAATGGGLLGYFLSKGILSKIYQSIVVSTHHDLRFSLSAYGVAPDSFTPIPRVQAGVYGIIALAVALMALLACMLFTLLVLRGQNPFVKAKRKWKQADRQKRKPVKPETVTPRQAFGAALSGKLPTTTLRYAVKSMLRGGKRSGVVPVLFAVLLTFLLIFSGVRADYRQQLANVYNDVPVTMQLSDISGRRMDGLNVRYQQIMDVWNSGFVQSMAVSVSHRYLYMGVAAFADGTAADGAPEVFVWPENPFALETFQNQLDFLTKPLVRTSNVLHAPAFFYRGPPGFTFAQGKSWDTFYASISGIILPQSTLEKEGLHLGDRISLVVFYTANGNILADQNVFEIMGSYNAGADRDEAYISAASYGVSRTDTNEGSKSAIFSDQMALYDNVFHSAGFVLNHVSRLSEIKDWLAQRYDAPGVPGHYRQWMIINDTALFAAIDTLNRHISYVNMVYPPAFMLVAGIGFLASSLLLKGRAGEMGVLQSVGADRKAIFSNLFLEQALLSVPGIVIGVLAASYWQGGSLLLYLAATSIFTVCYFAGTALAIGHTLRHTTLSAAAIKEA